MRKEVIANNEYYHIYNRGVDKRNIFLSHGDVARFYQSLIDFNSVHLVGSTLELSYKDRRELAVKDPQPLVDIVAYCLNPNHFHLILKQISDNGIAMFMKRLSGGYSLYFNNKQKRSGSLLQGRYKASHIESNEYLLHVSAYVNLNNKVHKLGDPVAKSQGLLELSVNPEEERVIYSSWEEYIDMSVPGICSKDIVLGQFKNERQYKKFALEALREIQKNKFKRKEAENILFE